MNPPAQTAKEEYAKQVCMFLAESLRTHKVALNRAAEIGQKVLDNINLIDTEADLLKLVKELQEDFEELNSFQRLVSFQVHRSQREEMEKVVREFVIKIMPSDPQQAESILLEAVRDETRLEDLAMKFPSFKEFAKL